MSKPMDVVILGLSITSSWGNGHATTYRGLVRELSRLGHRVLFLERDKPWYRDNRDMPKPAGCTTVLYDSLDELHREHLGAVRNADLVIVGSYVPEGVDVGAWVVEHARGVTAFYDIDTPVTLAKLERQDHEYLTPSLIREYDLYLSFTGGPTLQRLEQQYGSPAARALYCSCDPELYKPERRAPLWDLGYLGTYSTDRQPVLDRLMLQAARAWPQGKFVVAGPQYPKDIVWPGNVERVQHLAPPEHPAFYNSQRFTLNVTRADMVKAGYSPSVRLFEAAACGVPVISDSWDGLGEFFELGKEILVAHTADEVREYLTRISDVEREAMGRRARERVLAAHTAAHRAKELEQYVDEVRGRAR